MLTLIIYFIYILPIDYRWYITHTNEADNVEGAIRSVLSGRIIYPELQWEYFNITPCTTVE